MLKPSPRNHDPQNALIPKPLKIMHGEEEAEDRISSLPDCLLLEIISCVPTTKHAIKTSTLSKRWQHLWTLLPNLIFIAYEDVNKRGYYDHHALDGYFSFIDKTLTQCPTHVNLNKFKFLMRNYPSDFNTQKSQINSWIRYAITRNVQEVDIDLSCTGDQFRYDNDFVFKNLCATQMKLTGCVFINPICAISWEKLKWLCISYGILDEDVIANILSGSPCLETLELDNCFGFKSINITSKSVKNFVFSNYGCSNSGEDYYIDSIEINAPYILSLRIEYYMVLRELLLLNVSSLVKADLNFWSDLSLDDEEEEELLKGLLQSLGHVKKITLGNSNLKVLSRLEAKGFQFFEGADDSD